MVSYTKKGGNKYIHVFMFALRNNGNDMQETYKVRGNRYS